MFTKFDHQDHHHCFKLPSFLILSISELLKMFGFLRLTFMMKIMTIMAILMPSFISKIFTSINITSNLEHSGTIEDVWIANVDSLSSVLHEGEAHQRRDDRVGPGDED